MKITFDTHHNVAYIQLQESQETVKTVIVSEDLNVDMLPDGTVYGIELLNASEQLPVGEQLIIEDKAQNERREVTLR